MWKALLTLALSAATFTTPSAGWAASPTQAGQHPPGTSSAASTPKKPTARKPSGRKKDTNVKGYTRKDGTHVSPHKRSSPRR